MSEALSAVTLELDKVAPFLIKLFEIVSSAASDDLVCWSEHGETFRIVDRTKFAQVGPLPVGREGARRASASRKPLSPHTPSLRPPCGSPRQLTTSHGALAGRAAALLQA